MDSSNPEPADLRTPPVDSTAALRRAVRLGILGVLVLAVVGSVVAYLAAGLPGLWGALLGAAIGGGFILVTAVSVLFTAKLPPTTAMAVLLGSWLLKMGVALLVLGLLNPLEFYSRPALAIVMVGALVLVLGAETWGILSSRMLYVEPGAHAGTSAADTSGDAGNPEKG